jgi:hypothetical protein
MFALLGTGDDGPDPRVDECVAQLRAFVGDDAPECDIRKAVIHGDCDGALHHGRCVWKPRASVVVAVVVPQCVFAPSLRVAVCADVAFACVPGSGVDVAALAGARLLCPCGCVSGCGCRASMQRRVRRAPGRCQSCNYHAVSYTFCGARDWWRWLRVVRRLITSGVRVVMAQ